MNRTKLYVGVGFLIIGGIIIGGVAYSYATKDTEVDMSDPKKAAQQILTRMPVIDGHNDFPWRMRQFLFNDLDEVNFDSNLNGTGPWHITNGTHTDLPRLRTGRVGAQFWVAYTTCESQYKDAVEQTIEQIDVIKRLAKQYSHSLQFATSVADIEDAIKNEKIASLIGVEGGHQIQSSFATLRIYYELGVRYMTLTHSCNTPWADASPVDADNPPFLPVHNGISPFGIQIVHEMNRLGMMLDLSHVSAATMKAALTNSKAPVIFSHSSAWAICPHHRNVKDDVLTMIKETNSIIMVNFFSSFVNCVPNTTATLDHVVAHIEHIRSITGPDHIGIGADYDGVMSTPVGLEDVSTYPNLFEALIKTGNWTADELEKLAGRNLLRVFKAVEKVRDELQSDKPIQETMSRVEYEAGGGNLDCISAVLPGDLPKGSKQKRGISDDFQEL